MKRHSISLLAMLNFSLAGIAFADVTVVDGGLAPITPYRPSVSNSAQLPTPPQLELELGALWGRDAGTARHSLPYLFKLAWSKEWGVRLGGKAVIAANDGMGHTDRGLGDTNVVLKRAFLVDEATASGLEFGAKISTARDVLCLGKADCTINSILSKDLGAVHADIKLNATRLGGANAGTAPWQSGLLAALSSAVNEQFSVIGEWLGVRHAGEHTQGQALFALTFSPNKHLTMDAGFTKGLTRTTTHHTVFAGVVLPLAKLW